MTSQWICVSKTKDKKPKSWTNNFTLQHSDPPKTINYRYFREMSITCVNIEIFSYIFIKSSSSEDWYSLVKGTILWAIWGDQIRLGWWIPIKSERLYYRFDHTWPFWSPHNIQRMLLYHLYLNIFQQFND